MSFGRLIDLHFLLRKRPRSQPPIVQRLRIAQLLPIQSRQGCSSQMPQGQA
ncbi:hypothetical protein p1B63 (plasmid) [Aromatoleum aromaticum EbN1]|uniref:Uncharacterized protein n=1 Tax=Aromatoleum aromaticum (strain DSM 19018 / LMG 30748 / EbN1) TaxID=76114 RepID=Q5NXC3_AROAE|nr:hypothetical protein p1B63 [Aromatoleum aromaticum EbN1]